MNTTEVRLGDPGWTLAQLQKWIRQREDTGRSLLAISPIEERGMTQTTALTFEFTGAGPATQVVLQQYNGIVIPAPAGTTTICIGRCILKNTEAYVLASR
jgi:hypothetical protein